MKKIINTKIIFFFCNDNKIYNRFFLFQSKLQTNTLYTVYRGNPVIVRLGDLNLERNDDGAQPQVINIAQIIVHPNYKPPQLYNDIALIKLNRKVSFNKNVRPACLNVKREIDGKKVTATGWGAINYGKIRFKLYQTFCYFVYQYLYTFL